MKKEQLYGGRHDGLAILAEGFDTLLCHGVRYRRAEDGRLYCDPCRWDGVVMREECS